MQVNGNGWEGKTRQTLERQPQTAIVTVTDAVEGVETSSVRPPCYDRGTALITTQQFPALAWRPFAERKNNNTFLAPGEGWVKGPSNFFFQKKSKATWLAEPFAKPRGFASINALIIQYRPSELHMLLGNALMVFASRRTVLLSHARPSTYSASPPPAQHIGSSSVGT